MPFDWREYLALAQFVQTQSNANFGEEAARRCAVSRAYYAAFCFARNHAQIHSGFVLTGTAEDHGRLAEHLRQHGRAGEARRLKRLRQWRNQCDYRDEIGDLTMMTASALQQASDVISRL
ncbi:MAG: hypothetical protein KIS91_11365 [Anaerolineae bacterium]|jgi:hypothetical protein|nr:hypothetical protein [Anaerolineae bacterium]